MCRKAGGMSGATQGHGTSKLDGNWKKNECFVSGKQVLLLTC